MHSNKSALADTSRFFLNLAFIGALAILSILLLPQNAHAGPGSCGNVTWAHSYTVETNPFPPGSAGYTAWHSLYGDSHTVESSYLYAEAGLPDEDCGGPTATPTASIIAVPSNVASGDASSLTWSSEYATYCDGTNFSTGGAASGVVLVSPSSSMTYSVTCSNDYGSATASATVTVNPPPAPTATLSATPSSINSGQSSVLTWSSTNATSCTGTGFSTGGATSGTVSVSPSTTTSYLVSCTGAGGGASASATVTLSATNWVNMGCGPVSSTYNRSCNTTQEPVDITCDEGYHLEGASVYDCPIGSNYSSYRDVRRCVADVSCATPPPTPPSPLSASCSVSPTSVYTGSPVTWTATASGGTGSYAYSWSGTDSLSGAGSTVSKTYSTSGVKTASVTVTSGTSSQTVSCSNSAAVSVSLPDLTPSSVSPLTATTGTNTAFTAGVTNSGTGAASTFGSTLYVCLASDTACINSPLAHRDSLWRRILSFLLPIANANTSIKIAMNRISLAASASGSQTGSYTFSTSGSYKIQFCVDTPLNEVGESNESNCTAWTTLTVNPATLSASCSASPTTGYVGDAITWTATASGGTGSYAYSWSGTDSLSGTSASVSKAYNTTGTKTGSVTVTSGTQSVTPTCASSVLIKNVPTTLITATPTSIVKGVSPSRLDWSSSNATSCTSTKFSTGFATVGSVTVSPSTTTTYDLTCTDGTRNALSSATVTVDSSGLTLTVSPGTTVRQGDVATITWSVAGTPDSCSITGPGLSSTLFSGSQGVTINSESTYTLTCLSSGFPPVTKSITIYVTPHFQEF